MFLPVILCASVALATVSMKKLGKSAGRRVGRKKTYKEALMTVM